jgi:hypothetical protein
MRSCVVAPHALRGSSSHWVDVDKSVLHIVFAWASTFYILDILLRTSQYL